MLWYHADLLASAKALLPKSVYRIGSSTFRVCFLRELRRSASSDFLSMLTNSSPAHECLFAMSRDRREVCGVGRIRARQGGTMSWIPPPPGKSFVFFFISFSVFPLSTSRERVLRYVLPYWWLVEDRGGARTDFPLPMQCRTAPL